MSFIDNVSFLALAARRRVRDLEHGDIHGRYIESDDIQTLHISRCFVISYTLMQFDIAHIINHISFFPSSHCSQSPSRIRLITF